MYISEVIGWHMYMYVICFIGLQLVFGALLYYAGPSSIARVSSGHGPDRSAGPKIVTGPKILTTSQLPVFDRF